MKKNSLIYPIALLLTFCTGVAVSSCEDSKDDAMSEGLSIKVFSPTKVMEGQEVMITGTGLDEVTSVEFPGEVSVTDIRVITHNDIRVIVPAGISPDGGDLIIHAGDQSVTARVPVTIGNPSVATLSPGDKVGIGAELTITGTDMEFFEEAIFPGTEGDIRVAAIDFIRKSTSLLKLRVPAAIRSGRAQIRLVTCAGNEVWLPELHFVLDEKGPFEGEWIWASSAWGNGAYLVDRIPGWWSTSAGESLDEWAPGEGVAEASMVFSGPTLIKKLSDGTEVEGEYAVDLTKIKKDPDGNDWAIGQLVTRDVNVLCGVWPKAGEEHDIYTYDIIEFTDDRLVLAYAPDGTEAWGEAYFWIFERKVVKVSTYPADVDLMEGQPVTLEGIDDMEDWWIDPDFFASIEGSDNKFTFQAMDGSYRIYADHTLNYFAVEVLSGGEPATLNDDGTGAVWVIGDGIGKPSNANNIGWSDSKAICMAPLGGKKYRITLVAGEQINTDAINFKFFHQKGWGGGFQNNTLSTSSNLVYIGEGDDNGNVKLQPNVTLESDTAYEFVVDLSGGINNAVLTVTQK
ncbi:MAG: DUF5121 domain-containing protein [Bacteroides sp.]|nr:DUF5121 domain-containing protein [Bacteroides sp.]